MFGRLCYGGLVALLLSSAAWAAEPPAVAEPTTPAEKKAAEKSNSLFLRIARDDDRLPLSMDTAIVRYQAKKAGGPVVDLVAVVHVGEKAYYDQLNEKFKAYDAVLYELVAPAGAVPKAQRNGGGNPVSSMQHGLKKLLGLEFQLERIDYTPENFVHADMDPQQLAQRMRERGENIFAMFFRMMGHSLRQQAEGRGISNVELLLALLNRDRALGMKRVMAKQFEDLEGAVGALAGPNGSVLINDRNTVALDVLKAEIAAGRQKLAIFYGAGHMPDLEKRLIADFGLQPTGTVWLKAWNLADAAGRPQR